jgi:hypothetical protein
MMTEVEIASKRMYSAGSLEVKNIGFTLGSNRDLTAEDIAREINKLLDAVEAGDFEEVT